MAPYAPFPGFCDLCWLLFPFLYFFLLCLPISCKVSWSFSNMLMENGLSHTPPLMILSTEYRYAESQTEREGPLDIDEHKPLFVLDQLTQTDACRSSRGPSGLSWASSHYLIFPAPRIRRLEADAVNASRGRLKNSQLERKEVQEGRGGCAVMEVPKLEMETCWGWESVLVPRSKTRALPLGEGQGEVALRRDESSRYLMIKCRLTTHGYHACQFH